jgi:uncharacterized phiE125 gp8 family phage protein
MNISIISDSRNEPITVAEAKTHLRIDLSNEDIYIGKLIRSARESVERYCNISLTEKVIEQYFHTIGNKIMLPMPPLIEVTKFYYYNDAYTEYEMNNSIYKTITLNNLEESAIVLKGGNAWSTYTSQYGIKLKLKVGFNSSSTLTIPEELITEILNLVAYWYENRESEGTIPDSIMS